MKHLKFHASLAALPLLVTALALACCSRGNRPLSAEAFLKDFNNDRDGAYEKYKDKDILLTGKAIAAKEYKVVIQKRCWPESVPFQAFLMFAEYPMFISL